MAKEKKYGEIKVKKNIFPNEARKFLEKGTLGILLIQNSVSMKTKEILDEANITLYENLEPSEVSSIRETIREEKNQIRENLEKEWILC